MHSEEIEGARHQLVDEKRLHRGRVLAGFHRRGGDICGKVLVVSGLDSRVGLVPRGAAVARHNRRAFSRDESGVSMES